MPKIACVFVAEAKLASDIHLHPNEHFSGPQADHPVPRSIISLSYLDHIMVYYLSFARPSCAARTIEKGSCTKSEKEVGKETSTVRTHGLFYGAKSYESI